MTLYTPVYSLPYPELSDAPNGPGQLQALAQQTDSQLGAVDSRVSTVAANLTTTDAKTITHGAGRCRYTSTDTTTNPLGVYKPIPWANAVLTCPEMTAGGGSPPNTFTCAKPGVWGIRAWAHWGAVNTGGIYFVVVINGTPTDWGDTSATNATGENFRAVNSDPQLAAGDTIQIQWAASVALAPTLTSGGISAAVSLTWLRP